MQRRGLADIASQKQDIATVQRALRLLAGDVPLDKHDDDWKDRANSSFTLLQKTMAEDKQMVGRPGDRARHLWRSYKCTEAYIPEVSIMADMDVHCQSTVNQICHDRQPIEAQLQSDDAGRRGQDNVNTNVRQRLLRAKNAKGVNARRASPLDITKGGWSYNVTGEEDGC